METIAAAYGEEQARSRGGGAGGATHPPICQKVRF